MHEHCVQVGWVTVVFVHTRRGSARARVGSWVCGEHRTDREDARQRNQLGKVRDGVCGSAVEGLANGIKSGKSVPEVIGELLQQERAGRASAVQRRSKQVCFLHEEGGESRFRRTSGDVNLRCGSESFEGGQDLAGPGMNGEGICDGTLDAGHPGEWRVSAPIIEPAN